MFLATPNPPATVNAPVLLDVEFTAECTATLFDTSTFFPINKLPPTPAPPATVSAPEFVEVDSLLLDTTSVSVIFTSPSTDTLPHISSTLLLPKMPGK